MDRSIIVKRVIETLTKGKTKDYTYLTIFFIVFSIFIFFAIRPSLVTAFSLRKEEQDLVKTELLYDKTIQSVVTNQTILEQMRDKIPLFSSALPKGPNINKVLDDIQKAATENTLSLSNITIQEIELVDPTSSQDVRSFAVQAETGANFNQITNFLRQLQNQRRLKKVKMINIGTSANQEVTATPSGELQIRLEIEGFYL